jgi:hypothetical protein
MPAVFGIFGTHLAIEYSTVGMWWPLLFVRLLDIERCKILVLLHISRLHLDNILLQQGVLLLQIEIIVFQ